MSVKQILKSNVIVSCVPHKVKAKAVQLTLQSEITNQIPATILKSHSNWTLFFIDNESASLAEPSVLNK